MKLISNILLLIIIAISCNHNNSINLTYDKVVDLGTLNKNDVVRKKIKLYNHSNEVIIIKNVESSCGCTITKIDNKIIKPNNFSTLEIDYKAEEEDIKIDKSIVIESNTNSIFDVIYLKGNVKP